MSVQSGNRHYCSNSSRKSAIDQLITGGRNEEKAPVSGRHVQRIKIHRLLARTFEVVHTRRNSPASEASSSAPHSSRYFWARPTFGPLVGPRGSPGDFLVCGSGPPSIFGRISGPELLLPYAKWGKYDVDGLTCVQAGEAFFWSRCLAWIYDGC